MISKKYNNNDINALLNMGGKKTKTEGIKKTKSVNNKVTIVPAPTTSISRRRKVERARINVSCTLSPLGWICQP